MSLPLQAVDRLFARLAATYGAGWDRSLGSAPINDVKTAWAHELSGFADRLQDIAWALENLPDTCPNVIVFRGLCRRAPQPEAPRLEAPRADPERVRAELAKLQPILKRAAPQRHDRDWASALVSRAEAGEKIRPISLKFAREALRMPRDGGAHA
ncbi:MAG: hypothetical protein EOO31_09065 [Comamonadaceae bacterium]|nr:MAG: hypothetical protein EOO31_09065 [Comamonadaceae bacterium]